MSVDFVLARFQTGDELRPSVELDYAEVHLFRFDGQIVDQVVREVLEFEPVAL